MDILILMLDQIYISSNIEVPYVFIQLSKTHSYLTDYSKSCSLMPGLYSAKDTQIELCSG